MKTAAAQSGYNVTLFSPPQSNGTLACGIYSAGDVVGWYTLEDGERTVAFKRSVDGTFSDVGPPINYKHQAYAGGINDAGEIVGTVSSVAGLAFVSNNGTYTYFGDKKNAADGNGINNTGTYVGSLVVETNLRLGFIESQRARPYILYLGDGAALLGINNAQTAVGDYQCGSAHGLIWTKSGTQTLDVPGATSTGAFGINDNGVVVGGTNLGQFVVMCDGVGPTLQGFLYSNGVYTPFNVAGATGTILIGINNAGQLVGSVYVGFGAAMGFIATPQ